MPSVRSRCTPMHDVGGLNVAESACRQQRDPPILGASTPSCGDANCAWDGAAGARAGAWSRDLKMRTNLTQPALAKILKTLEARKLIKARLPMRPIGYPIDAPALH